jgi:hypothetical protein
MIQTIILVVVVGVAFFTRKMWLGYITDFVSKKKKPQVLDVRPFQLPQGLVRNFVIAIEIEEKGDGSAKFEVKKIIK